MIGLDISLWIPVVVAIVAAIGAPTASYIYLKKMRTSEVQQIDANTTDLFTQAAERLTKMATAHTSAVQARNAVLEERNLYLELLFDAIDLAQNDAPTLQTLIKEGRREEWRSLGYQGAMEKIDAILGRYQADLQAAEVQPEK